MIEYIFGYWIFCSCWMAFISAVMFLEENIINKKEMKSSDINEMLFLVVIAPFAFPVGMGMLIAEIFKNVFGYNDGQRTQGN